MIGILVGYFAKTLQTSEIQQPLAQVASSSHAVFIPEVRHPVEVGADEADHLNRWLSKRLQAAVIAPDLTDLGIKLVGGRLLHDAGKPAAFFMYENQDGGRFTLYIRNSESKTNPDSNLHYQTIQGFGVSYWYQNDLSYAFTGVENAEYMHDLATRLKLSTSKKTAL